MASFNVSFENPVSFYFEGEKIIAKVEVNVENDVEIKWLTASIRCTCKCIEEKPSETNSSSIWHVVLPGKSEVKKNYFDFNDLVYSINENKTNRLLPGTHQFMIECQLPSFSPSSIESSDAYVRYFTLITGDIDSEIVKKIQYFTVVSKVDLNKQKTNTSSFISMYENVRPISCAFTFGNLFSLSCFRYGHIRAFLHIDKRSYVPGEEIKMDAEIINLCNHPVDWVKAVFVQIIKFTCSKFNKRKRIVHEVTRGCVMPNDSQIWKNEGFPVPALPPTTIDSSKILISVGYKLYLEVKPSWKDKPMVTKTKLVIGSIPMREIDKSHEIGQGDVCNFSSKDLEIFNFEPCFFGPYDVEDEGDVTPFAPMYPVYEISDE